MKIVRVRDLERSKAKYIYMLQSKGKIKKYSDKYGYACFDEEEYKEFRKNTKQGRPVKCVVEGGNNE